MNKENSVIGYGYIPCNVEAICLKTNREAELGKVEYKIIAEPYEREWSNGMLLLFGMPKAEKRMTVNVLDPNTGLTYAVEYEPANLIRTTPEPGASKLEEKVKFIDRARQIVEELNAIFSAEGISDKCGVAFFSISDNGDDKTSTGAAFVAGSGERVISSISAACSKDLQALELVTCGTMEAMLRRMFAGSKKKE